MIRLKVCFIIFPAFLFSVFTGCALQRDWVRRGEKLDSLVARARILDSLQRIQDRKITELAADLSYELTRVRDRIENLDYKIEDNLSRLLRISQKLGVRIEEPQITQVPPESALAFDPDQLYNSAYLDFTRGNYELAMQGFREYLKHFPDSELADNAQYWIGESYYTQKDWQNALQEFEKVEKNYPRGNKIAGAQYKIGLCYLNLKLRNKAKEYLKKVIDKYPNSHEAKLAQERLKEIR